MKTNLISLAFVIISLMLAGCIPSVHGLYTDDVLVFNESLSGNWTDQDSGVWEFSTSDSISYSLAYTEELPYTPLAKNYFKVHLVRLGDEYYLDFFPNDDNQLSLTSMLANSLLPTHLIAKIEFPDGEVIIRLMNPERLKEMVSQGLISVKHEITDNNIVLTAQPKELQAFVTEFSKDAEAFATEKILKRN